MENKKINAKYVVKENEIEVYCPFSWQVVGEAKSMGGWFDREKVCWIFPIERLPEIQEKLGKIGEIVRAKVPISKTTQDSSITIGWYVLANRRTRDSKANLFATLISGKIAERGGSVKHPKVDASEDSVFSVYMYKDFAEKKGLEFEKIE